MMDWFYEVCQEMEGWMAHSKEATYDVDQDAPISMLDKTQNFTTKRGNTYYSLHNEEGIIFMFDVSESKSVTLLRTGESMDFEFRESSLRIMVPQLL